MAKSSKLQVGAYRMEVRNNRTTVLANSAERAEEIDVAWGPGCQEAGLRLASSPEINILRAEVALQGVP